MHTYHRANFIPAYVSEDSSFMPSRLCRVKRLKNMNKDWAIWEHTTYTFVRTSYHTFFKFLNFEEKKKIVGGLPIKLCSTLRNAYSIFENENMTRIDGLSPLSTRDLNRIPIRQEENDNDIQKRQDEAICIEEIKARFDRDFLPKYGHLWRQIIREKDNTTTTSDGENLVDTTSGSFQTSFPNPRALNFLEAIERKQAVSISAVPEECECAPPIAEFVELDEEQTKHITTNRRKRSSYNSKDSQSETTNTFEAVQNNIQCSETMSGEETETEDEEDMESVYETADEFEDEDEIEHNRTTDLVEAKEKRVAIENGAKEQKAGNYSKTTIIDIDSGSDDMGDNASKSVSSPIGRTTITHNNESNGNDERGLFGLGVSKLRIAIYEKDVKGTTVSPYIGTDRSTCLSPRLDEDIPSPNGSTSTSNAVIYDPLVDTDEEGDDEHDEYDSESDDDEEEDEAEWLPDDASILSSQRQTPQPKKAIENKKIEKWRPKEVIDLCDGSSSDDASDTDYSVSSDNENILDTKKQIAPSIVKKTKDKGRSKASFRRKREQLTVATFDEFNRKAFRGELGKVVVQWSQKLNTTAGLTRLQKVSTDMMPGMPLKRLATIELSTKVVDNEEKLRTTLLHELVHAAVWIFEGISKPPHGPDFKRWAKIAMSKVPDVIVTTTHNYEIQYKFNWACVNPKCSFTIGRHSKSVDIIRHRCGRCRGKLIEVTADGKPKKQAQPSAYNLFVKQHSKTVREQLVKRKPGVTQPEVMKELGRLWREQKSRSKRSADQ